MHTIFVGILCKINGFLEFLKKIFFQSQIDPNLGTCMKA
jgi:hypothetical protein